jgi:hypothetical protein
MIGGFGANHHLRQALVYLNMPTLHQPEAYIGGVDKVLGENGEFIEAAQILRMSRPQLYNRIHDGSLKSQRDSAQTYTTRAAWGFCPLLCSRQTVVSY